jgi:hypothetical protein
MQHILICVDYGTRYCVAKPVRNARKGVISSFFQKEIFEKFGYPKEVISDQGRQMMSKVVRKFCEQWGKSL